MGGGPDKETLVIVSPGADISSQVTALQQTYPHFTITVLDGTKPPDELKQQLTPLWKSMTIYAALGNLPPTPDLVPNLKLIHLFFAGVDSVISHPILTDSEIPITTASGVHGPPISEWILGATLFLSKSLNVTYDNQRSHHWGSVTHRSIYGSHTDWVNKRVGIAGYGSIGRQVARVFNALGAKVVAYTAGPRSTQESRRDKGYIVPRTGDPEGSIPEAWFSGTSSTELNTFVSAELDCLICCLPLTPSTRGLFGRKEFELMKKANGKPSFFVNISRGAIVRQDELTECLNDGTLAGAALDVADPEPLPEGNKLWDAKNLLLSPHVSALGKEYMGRAMDILVLNIKRLEKGGELVNEVKRKRGY
jgi:phosphoglycerate dehydrogenase-like enzyme